MGHYDHEARSAARKAYYREWAISYYGTVRHRVGMRIDRAAAAGEAPSAKDLQSFQLYTGKLALLGEMTAPTPRAKPVNEVTRRDYRELIIRARARLHDRTGRRSYKPGKDIALVRKYAGLLGEPEPWWLAEYLRIEAHMSKYTT